MDPIDERDVGEHPVIDGVDHALVGEFAAQDHPIGEFRKRRIGRRQPFADLRERFTRPSTDLLIDQMPCVPIRIIGVCGDPRTKK